MVDVLEETLSDLRIEIAETEQWEFRRYLLNRKLSLMTLLAKIKETSPTAVPLEKQSVKLPQPPIADHVYPDNPSHPVY